MLAARFVCAVRVAKPLKKKKKQACHDKSDDHPGDEHVMLRVMERWEFVLKMSIMQA